MHPRPTLSRSRRGTVAIALAVAAVVPLAVTGCSPEAAGSGDAERVETAPVVVHDVEFVPQRTRLEAVGTSRAERSATIYPAAAGEVVVVHFRPGQYVGQGAVLVELDARNERVAVKLAKVALADAERQYDRYSRMEGSGAVVPATLDAARAALEKARLELESAEIALADRTIEAPFAGYVGVTDVDAGDRIGPDTAITTLDARKELLVTFEAPELMIDDLSVGHKIEISTWDRSALTTEGEIVAIDSRVDPANRSFVVRAKVDNGNDRLRPGMSFRVKLDMVGATWPAVPEVALQWGSDGAYVWALENGRALRVPATIVQRDEGRVLIDADLAAGARIVVEGVQRMRDGMTILELDVETVGPDGLAKTDATS
ncbi:MAG TPA: efflux RND transporter periplasmic adaptor subunit [Gammaproteobacteria bacterium]|nr:efflux RND transporter periplasmic adaptor subunit [Gammaproteobacteria bacterium]